MTLTLQKEWLEHLKLVAKADELWMKATELWAKADELRVEGNELSAKADELRVEGNELWARAVEKADGIAKAKWVQRDGESDCHLPNGEVYRWDMTEGE